MTLKSVLVAGALGLSALSLAACSNASADADGTTQAEPSAAAQELNATIEACHVAVAATDGWRDLDSGALYELAKDKVKENPDAITTPEGTGMSYMNFAITHCARNMTAYANGGSIPSGLTE